MSPTDQKSIGEAIGRVAAGIFVVTAKHGDESAALLASWVQQASFEPPLVTVAVKAGRPIERLLDVGAPFAINVLGQRHKELVAHFAKGFKPGKPAFAGVDTIMGTTGDHVLCIGHVVAGAVTGPDQPDVRFRKPGFTY